MMGRIGFIDKIGFLFGVMALLFLMVVPPSWGWTTFCISAEVCFSNAMVFYRQGDSVQALGLFRELLERHPDDLYQGLALFVMGKILSKKGDPEAEVFLEQAARSGIPIRDYARKEWCQFLEKQTDSDRTAVCYQNLFEENPDSPLRSNALFQAGLYFKKSGEFSRSEETFRSWLTLFPSGRRVPDVLYPLGEMALDAEREREAARYFKRIWIEYPMSEHAGSAEKILLALRKKRIPDAGISFEDFLERASRFYKAGQYRNAADAYAEILADPKAKAKQRREAAFQSAMSHYHLRQWEKSSKAYEKYLQTYPKEGKKEETLFWLGKAYLKQERKQDYLHTHQRYLDQYPKGKHRGEVLFGMASFYKEQGKTEKAVNALRRLRQEVSGTEWRAKSLWEEGWWAYQNGDHEQAVLVWDRLSDDPGLGYEAQALYWKGRSYERMGRWDQSEARFRRLCDRFPYSYYCLAATELWAQDYTPETRRFVGFKTPSEGGKIDFEIIKHPRYPRVFALFQVGMGSEASQEARSLQGDLRKDKNLALSMARLLYRLGDAPHTIHIMQDQFADALVQGAPAFDDDFWEMAYPLVYIPMIESYASMHGVDPALVAALIREESWYNPAAESPAGALGLMQVMPNTARILEKGFQAKNLMEPEWNIILGTRFLADLLIRFRGEPALAAAAYNAGPGAVERWLREYGSIPPDEFIEAIPYPETRRYVKRVLRSYAEYRRIYVLTGERQRQYSFAQSD